jgi:hypothetical protein
LISPFIAGIVEVPLIPANIAAEKSLEEEVNEDGGRKGIDAVVAVGFATGRGNCGRVLGKA